MSISLDFVPLLFPSVASRGNSYKMYILRNMKCLFSKIIVYLFLSHKK